MRAKAPKRTVEQILADTTCGPTDAMRVLRCRYPEVIELVNSGKVRSYRRGRRTKIVVASLQAYARGEAQPAGPVGGPE